MLMLPSSEFLICLRNCSFTALGLDVRTVRALPISCACGFTPFIYVVGVSITIDQHRLLTFGSPFLYKASSDRVVRGVA